MPINNASNHNLSIIHTGSSAASSKGISPEGTRVEAGPTKPSLGWRVGFSEWASKISAGFKRLTQRSVQQKTPGPARSQGDKNVDSSRLLLQKKEYIGHMLFLTTKYHKDPETAFSDPDTLKEATEYMTLFAALPNAAEFLQGLPKREREALADVFTLAGQKAKSPDEQKTGTKLANDLYVHTNRSTQPVSEIAHAVVDIMNVIDLNGSFEMNHLLDKLRALAVNPQAAKGMKSLSEADCLTMVDALELARQQPIGPADNAQFAKLENVLVNQLNSTKGGRAFLEVFRFAKSSQEEVETNDRMLKNSVESATRENVAQNMRETLIEAITANVADSELSFNIAEAVKHDRISQREADSLLAEISHLRTEFGIPAATAKTPPVALKVAAPLAEKPEEADVESRSPVQQMYENFTEAIYSGVANSELMPIIEKELKEGAITNHEAEFLRKQIVELRKEAGIAPAASETPLDPIPIAVPSAEDRAATDTKRAEVFNTMKEAALSSMAIGISKEEVLGNISFAIKNQKPNDKFTDGQAAELFAFVDSWTGVIGSTSTQISKFGSVEMSSYSFGENPVCKQNHELWSKASKVDDLKPLADYVHVPIQGGGFCFLTALATSRDITTQQFIDNLKEVAEKEPQLMPALIKMVKQARKGAVELQNDGIKLLKAAGIPITVHHFLPEKGEYNTSEQVIVKDDESQIPVNLMFMNGHYDLLMPAKDGSPDFNKNYVVQGAVASNAAIFGA